MQTSNYGGLYRATYNPAITGAPRQKWQVNIGTAAGSINYRYFVFLGKNSLLYPILAPHSTRELYGRSRTMGSLIQRNPVYLASEIRWPSAMVSLGKYSGLALQLRTRGYFYGKNIPDAIQNLYFKRLDTESTPVTANQPWGNFSLVQQSFSEANVSYGAQLLDLRTHKLRVGVTGKRIFGARTAYMNASADHFGIRQTSGNVKSSELVLSDFRYESGYSAQVQKMRFKNLFDSGHYGSGWAYDFGFSYELGAYWGRKKEEFDKSPEYLIRLGASLTDIGFIKYKTLQSRVISGMKTEAVIGQNELETISDFGPEGFMNLFPAKTDTIFRKNVQLPQAVHLEADIQLVKGFFLHLEQTRRYRSQMDRPLDIYRPNLFTITPRFEDEDSDFAFPVSFVEGNKRPSLGAFGHFGPLFLGFSNVNGLFKKRGAKGSMLYIGFTAWKMNRKDVKSKR
ncbi:hypothetical protein FEM33_11500 [Dyadobacter flavalbus]|uniref:DUF5723 domain-containing protein n=1 Tax=Dyadobacter flavalbus TaxID=2579942 RepID=A0A5M8QY28_9BACT|nr:DUF5723 family protein [Dyadobacter flavalbus]KAA6439634.1 hypothetical protein FEM33_11500 [Dyadobacter flavalbus]